MVPEHHDVRGPDRLGFLDDSGSDLVQGLLAGCNLHGVELSPLEVCEEQFSRSSSIAIGARVDDREAELGQMLHDRRWSLVISGVARCMVKGEVSYLLKQQD